LILDGFEGPTDMSNVAREWLTKRLKDDGHSVKVIALTSERIGHCIGCFGCWVKTPGECVINDAGRTVASEIMNSELIVYLTPVRYGCYSSSFKKALDRIIPIIMHISEK
jgi:multimeric flavodoxin WrbA